MVEPFPFLIEVCIVFTKDTTGHAARTLLEGFDLPFREGSDSSKGKVYYYSTGPKYIMHVPRSEASAVVRKLEALPQADTSLMNSTRTL